MHAFARSTRSFSSSRHDWQEVCYDLFYSLLAQTWTSVWWVITTVTRMVFVWIFRDLSSVLARQATQEVAQITTVLSTLPAVSAMDWLFDSCSSSVSVAKRQSALLTMVDNRRMYLCEQIQVGMCLAVSTCLSAGLSWQRDTMLCGELCSLEMHSRR